MKLRKVLSLLVAFVMMVQVLPLASFATEIEDTTESVEAVATVTEDEGEEAEETEETVEEAESEDAEIISYDELFGNMEIEGYSEFGISVASEEVVDDSDQIATVSESTNSDSSTVRYCVLILDTSGSMSGTPLSVQKEAAIKFCESILAADGDNYVAIVKLNTTSSTLCNFTSDLDTLKSKINSTSASGGTNTAQALTIAGNLLDAVDNDSAIKNIVLCTDGLPEHGSTSSSGPYTSSDYAWYKYANYAYTVAQTLKESYTIYSLGFFHSLSGSTLTFAEEFMSDLATEGCYYEVTDPDYLIFEFGNISGDITGNTDNTLVSEQDWWNFSNSQPPFATDYFLGIIAIDKRSDGYYISDSDFEALVKAAGDSNKVKELLTNQRESSWGGSCFGMSAIVCLIKAGVLDVDDIQSKADSLWGVEFTDEVESYINFWHLEQYLSYWTNVKSDYYGEYGSFTDANKRIVALNKLIQMVSEVQDGGSPVLVEFSAYKLDDNGAVVVDDNYTASSMGHAIVAYDVKYGCWLWNNYEYDVCIVTYDPNFPNGNEGNEYIYINTETGDWTIPFYSNSYCNGDPFSSTHDLKTAYSTRPATACAGWIRLVTNDVSEIDFLNQGTYSSNNNAYLIIYMGYGVTVTSSSGASYTLGVGGDLPIYYGTNVTLDGGSDSSSGTVILPDSEASYTMTAVDAAFDVSYMLEYNNSLIIVEADSVDTVEISQTSVGVEGDCDEVSLTLVSNEGYYVTPWYDVTLTTEDVEVLSLSMNDSGYLVEGTDLTDIVVYGTNDYETVELTFSTDKEKALVTEDSAENMIVLTDEDDNGTYETVIATTNSDSPAEEQPTHTHTTETVIENYVAATATTDGSYDSVTYCTECGEIISESHTVIAAYGSGTGETIDWATALTDSVVTVDEDDTNVTTEDVVIDEPIEPTDTETEDDGEEPTAEPTVEAETPAETNPTTGIVISLIPMAIAALAAVSSKRR